MGVQGIFPMLRELGMSDTPVDNALTLGIDTIHYDVKACHYGDMMREMTNVRHSDSTGVIAALAATIDQKIKLWRNHLDKDVTFVLHIDAPGSAAKGPTHLKRHLKREAAARKLEYNLRVLERKKGRWVPHKVIGRIDKDLRTCCQLTLETRDALVAALKHLGHDVCVCRAETDPCIATQCYQHEGPKEAAVLSIDSDYLFYQGVKTLLRPNPKGPGLLHYSRDNVKKALGLIRDEELIVYGCVNRNDYNSNVPTIGLVRSLKLIRPDAENEDSDASSYNSHASGNDPESSGDDPESSGDDPESSGNDSGLSDEEPTSDDEGSHSGYTDTDSDTKGRPAKKRAKTLSSRKPLPWSDKGKAPMRNARALVADAAAEASSSRISILRSDKGKTPVRNVDVSMDVDTAVPEAQSGGQLRSITFQNQPLQGHVGTDLGSLASLRQLIAQFCDDVGAIVKMRVPVSMFEASLRTFGFLSQLKTGEEPEDHEDQIPLWEEPTDDEPDSLSPLSLLQLPNLPEPEKSPDELLQTFQLQFKDYCRLRRARRETFYPPERVEEFKRPHNQYGHAFRKDKDGRHTFLNGRTVTIDSSKEKRVPPKPISRVIQSTAARGQKSKKNKKSKRRRKKKPVQTKRKQDRIEKQPEGAGAFNNGKDSWTANQKESAAHIPAIRWFQEQNKEGIFKDFVFGSNARKYQVVTEQDLYCFLKAAPPPSTQPQPQYLSEISRFDFEPLLKGLFPKARRGDDMKEGQRADYINDNKGWLTTSLLYDRAPQHVTEGRVPGRDGYCHKVKLQSETSNRRYILGTGYHSDGKVLTLLASDTFSEKPIRKRKKKLPTFGPEDEDEVAAAAACAGSGEGNGDGDDDDDDDDDDDEDENEEGAMGKRGKCKAPVPISSHLYEKDDKHACYEFAPPEDLQAFLVGTKSGYQCNLASRTKLLPNAALLKWDSANSPKIIIGGDPGEHVALATTRIERGSSDVRNTVKIRRTMLYEPYWRFRRTLGEKKKEELIDILESMTPSRKLGNVVQYLNFMNSNIQEALLPHARSDDDRAKISLMSGTVGEVIFAFYHSSWLLKKMWDCKKAQRSALDLAVGAVLAQAGFKPNSKRQDQPTVIFAYGMATFNTRRGPASKAVVVEKKVVKALRGLGQIVVGEHEYFTSQKCPRRDCDEFLEKLDNRSMYCRKCNMFFDRDAVGSENIAFICQEFVEGRTRPAKFLPATTVVAAPATSVFVPTAAGSS
ncbi:hypothetical protein EMPS_06259 [Entomortierella parvispora]|uniref:Cas12f1-like TNB domain-containing protein n=1 Tax=Entomortierella parvispora TaxID=205924 RepID=A0A9P3LX20_9FUNG|nr:hypothetical protein EMPS_06259 [Entomortierella parvispora]